MTAPIDWSHWETFLAVMRTGTLSGAARQLQLAQPTVGRQIAALEQSLGQVLFTRSRLGLEPTSLALALLPHGQSMQVAAEALQRVSSGDIAGASGTVRITASEVGGVVLLPRALASFRHLYPDIAIEVSLSNDNEDLLRRDADIALRMVRPVQDAIVAKFIGPVAVGLYAHRSYADRCGLPNSVAALFDHALIGPDRDRTRLAGISLAGRPLSRDVFSFRVDDDVAQLAALRAGLGIGVCQQRIAQRDPDLLPVLPDDLRFDLELWLAIHEDQRNVPRVRLLFDHLQQALLPWTGTQG
ncbi:LysR family transcriptional regulator [Altererythrobacter xixiisoli]|uniref:LysR family transcriptional regulator n=1 Tax=Croceibacterium xixiisoli TaxID=1476466 RepID=A0A6I4TX86_9SPHN|nr:LysR family transcriptional regulator [Croceibacterium xixiisoli]MXP00615.1 LysR family transcriptional regulator [Croceibacterium xixiisoli]